MQLGLYHIYRLDGESVTIVYLQGNCTWKASGFTIKQDSSKLRIQEGESGTVITCEVGSDILLTTEVVLLGKYLSLDIFNNQLQWKHQFLPDLPTDFELVYDAPVTFEVHVSGRNEDTGTIVSSLNITLLTNVLDLTPYSLQACVEYEFLVSAAINTSTLQAGSDAVAVNGSLNEGFQI